MFYDRAVLTFQTMFLFFHASLSCEVSCWSDVRAFLSAHQLGSSHFTSTSTSSLFLLDCLLDELDSLRIATAPHTLYDSLTGRAGLALGKLQVAWPDLATKLYAPWTAAWQPRNNTDIARIQHPSLSLHVKTLV